MKSLISFILFRADSSTYTETVHLGLYDTGLLTGHCPLMRHRRLIGSGVHNVTLIIPRVVGRAAALR